MQAPTLLGLLHCPLCPPPALLRAPVTLHCGHTVCASHFDVHSAPSSSRHPDAVPILPRCPLATCAGSNSSRSPVAFTHLPPVDVTTNKLIDLLLNASQEPDPPPPAVHDDPDEHTEDEYETDSELEYLPLPASDAQASTQDPSSASLPPAPSRHRSRSRSPPSSSPHPRKRRRRHVAAEQSRTPPHRTDHEPQARLEKQLLSELTCEICFGLFWQPVTTPCQHTFCTRCLFRSLDHSQNCPLCRTKLPGYDYFQQHPCNKVVLAIILNAFPDAYAERGAAVEADERDARLDTPLFVCQLSFPGMPTYLHFFEPRYRLMLRRCLESDSPCFGMVPPPRAAPSASSNGSTSTGNDYGTMLQIHNVQTLPDGRSIVETWGTWRFRVMERGLRDGYAVARVERIEDYEDDLDEDDATGTRAEEEEATQEPNTAAGAGLSNTTGLEASEEPRTSPTAAEAAEAHRADDALETAVRAAIGGEARPGPSSLRSESETGQGAISGEALPADESDHRRRRVRSQAAVAAEAAAEKPPSASTGLSTDTNTAAVAPRRPSNAELMAKCHAFIDQTREGIPWVGQALSHRYVPMPSDPASFSFWMALILPIDDHEKAKLLPIRSPRLRLRLVVHWIEKLNSQWWFSRGCVIS